MNNSKRGVGISFISFFGLMLFTQFVLADNPFVKKEVEPEAADNKKVDHSVQGFRNDMTRQVAKYLITHYYNNYGMWAGRFKIKSIKRIRLKHFNKRRVIAHAEYVYSGRNNKNHLIKGVDKRTFTLIKHERWAVISMGKHMSGNF